MPDKRAIAATGLRKSFGDHVVLDGIDLEVAEGTIFALLGPNGAGKTTIVQILSTLIGADAGALRVAGHDTTHRVGVADCRDRRNRSVLGRRTWKRPTNSPTGSRSSTTEGWSPMAHPTSSSAWSPAVTSAPPRTTSSRSSLRFLSVNGGRDSPGWLGSELPSRGQVSGHGSARLGPQRSRRAP